MWLLELTPNGVVTGQVQRKGRCRKRRSIARERDSNYEIRGIGLADYQEYLGEIKSGVRLAWCGLFYARSA